jgi:flagellar basal body-associated protein FliL
VAPGPQTANQKPKSKSFPLIVFLVLAATAAGTFWFVSRRAGEAASSDPKANSVKSVIHLDSFVVNLADPDQSAFLKIGIDLGVSSTSLGGKSGDTNTPVLPQIRDAILSVLTTWQSSGLLAADGKAKLKEQILNALHQQVPALPVREVYFTEFLVQR